MNSLDEVGKKMTAKTICPVVFIQTTGTWKSLVRSFWPKPPQPQKRFSVTHGFRYLLFASGLSWLTACASAAPKLPQTVTQMANPAVIKCLQDGWRTEPLLTNGAPTDTLCIDPISGQRCEAWAYFRGDCQAPNKPLPNTEK